MSHLEINASLHGPAVVEYLGRTSMVGGGKRWPLPKLERLKIYDTDVDPRKVLDMVKSRYACQKDPGDSPCARLVSLDLADWIAFDEDTYQKLVEVLDEGCVEWELYIEPEEEEDSEFER